MGACKDAPAEEKESSVHWSYPEPPIVERSVLDEKLDRKEIFMLFTLDGQVQDTLWFKSQDKNRWASLLTVEALQSPKGAEKLTFSLPGEEAHVEFHWHNFEVGERVSMNFSDSVYPADYFRIVDRRENVHEASSQARLYMAEQVKTEVHGVKLYPISEEDQRLSGHISMEFSGTFRERGNDTRHLIEGYIGAW
jgi:hypothetical protein